LVDITEHAPEQVLWVLENKEALETTDLGIAKSEPVDQDEHQNEQYDAVNINKEITVHNLSDVPM
jgi:hypothetical protein